MKLVRIKKAPSYDNGGFIGTKKFTSKKLRDFNNVSAGYNDGGFIQDHTGLGTYLYNQPVEMQLSGMNPIVGGPVDVMAQDQMGQQAFIPAYSQDPTMMYGNVKEVPMMKYGGKTPIRMNRNKGMPNYNPHRMFHSQDAGDLNPTYEDRITGSVKPVDREDANIEAEKGEIIMKPNMMGLYKIGGKTHKQGGTPLYAEGGSFIFSNDKNLSITKQERDLFDLKEFKSKSIRENTPAKVLEREIKPKEYNNFVNIMTDDKYDNISKQTAALMLDKMNKKIGQVAYIQEARKNSPIPEFAMGSAPIVSDEIAEQERQQKVYQLGGYFGMKYAPKRNSQKQVGSIYPEIYPGGVTQQGRITPTGIENTFDYPFGDPRENSSKALVDKWKTVGVDLTGKTPAQAQELMYNWSLVNNPDLARNMWGTFGNTAKGIREGINLDFNNMSDPDLNTARPAYVDNMLGVRTFGPRRPIKGSNPFSPIPYDYSRGNIPEPGLPEQPTVNPPVARSLPYDIKGRLNGSQLAHLSALGLQAMNIRRYYPKREQVDLPEVNLDTINSQPYVNAINNQGYQAYAANRTANPQMASIANSNIYGRGLDAMSQTLGNIDNQNVQIQNQENLTNLQQRTNQILTNTQYDDRYYDQVQDVRQNFDNERRFAGNQFFGTLNQYQSQADQLAWALASVNKYGKRRIVDPKTGQMYDQPVPLYEYMPGRGIRYNADVADINLATGADRVNSAQEAQNILKQFGVNPNDPRAVYSISRLLDAVSGRGKQPLYGSNPYLPTP